MTNNLIFLASTLLVMLSGLICLRLGKAVMIAWIALLGVLANLFVVKQIVLFGFHATASDVFAIGSILGLNLLREQYDLKACKQAIMASFACLTFFCMMSQIHLLYLPSTFDTTHQAFVTLLEPNPRILLASITVFFGVQLFDMYFYSFILRPLLSSLIVRNGFSLVISQALDTVLFSFLGLYGLLDNILEIMVISYGIKVIAIAIMVPFSSFSKRMIAVQS